MTNTTSREDKFFQKLQEVFVGAKIEGQGGFINLMRVKSNYYSKIEQILKTDIDKALKQYPTFREELFDKLYTFLTGILPKVDPYILIPLHFTTTFTKKFILLTIET